jgi:hypothetical protein
MREGNNYKCNFFHNFSDIHGYADVTCAVTAVVADSTDDIIFTGHTAGNSVNIGPAAATGAVLTPVATFSFLDTPGPAGFPVTLSLYNVDLVVGDAVSVYFTDADAELLSFFSNVYPFDMFGFVLTFNATHATFTKDSTPSVTPSVLLFGMSSTAAVDYSPHVVITNASGNGNALKTIDTSMIKMPNVYESFDENELGPGPDATSIAFNIDTNQPQVVEIHVYPGSLDGEPILTNAAFQGDSACGYLIPDTDGVYKIWADATALPAGGRIKCALVMTLKSYFCTGDECAFAPTSSIFSRAADEVVTFDYIPIGDPTIKLARTRGAFSSAVAGFAIYASYFPTGSTVTVNNDFGLTAPIDVYAVTDTEVGETPVGSATSDGNGNLVITVNDLISSNGLEGFSGYVAVPIFVRSDLLPTIKDVEITATVGDVNSTSVTVGNGDAIIEITPADFTTPIRQNTEFFVNFTLTSTHLDELTAKIDFSATGATFNACENDLPDAVPSPYVVAAMKLTGDVPEAEAEDGILTIPVPKTDATVEGGLAKYSYMCSFTAGAYVKGATAATVPIDVVFGTTIVKTADLTVPAPSRLPVAGTKLSVDIVRDTLFSASELAALLSALVKVMQNLDPTFDIARFYGITQKINVYSPNAVHVAVTGNTVTLSTSFTGVSVTDTAALAIEANCTEGCGTEECGLCLDGNACTDASQCFSNKCGGGVCGRDNSAASVTVALCSALAVLASLMLF